MKLKFWKTAKQTQPVVNNTTEVWGRYTPQMKAKVFVKGHAQLQKELQLACSRLGLMTFDIEEDIYALICAKVFLDGYGKDALVTYIANQLPTLTPGQALLLAREVFVKYVCQVERPDSDEEFETSMKAKGFSSDANDYAYEEIPAGKGDFGICLTNPVPVHGIPSSRNYLFCLLTADGRTITTHRIGQFRAPNIPGPIDGYEVVDSRGQKCPTIYISPYHPFTSMKAPKGYKFAHNFDNLKTK